MNEIESVLQQLDPTFKLFVIEQSPISQILNCIKQATTLILQSRVNTEESLDFNLKSICEHCGKSSRVFSKQEKIISEEKEKLNSS